jgi:molecular chaperone DnaK
VSVVGIDLGTTNTVLACVKQGRVHVLADEQGSRLLPSVVSFHPNGEVLVGANAKSRRTIDPKNTVASIKRLIGRPWNSQELTQARQRFAFELREGPGQGPLVHCRGQDYTLPEISAFVLKRAKQISEQALGEKIDRAVITVPAHFNELQRASTKVAGRVSGLEVMRILNEPTAAALAYGLGRTGHERVAVFDFGGGTFDCTLLDLSGNVFEVLATAGDSFLGGDDLDLALAERMADALIRDHGYDARNDAAAFEKLRAGAEHVKIELTSKEETTLQIPEIGYGVGGAAINFVFRMKRGELEALATPLVDRTFKVCQDALNLAKLTPTAFDKVILVGGSTRMPLVKQRVEAFFGSQPMDRVNPDEVVAIGAAIQAAALTDATRRRDLPAPPVPGAGVRGAMPPATMRGAVLHPSDAEEHTRTTEFQKQNRSAPPGSPDAMPITARGNSLEQTQTAPGAPSTARGPGGVPAAPGSEPNTARRPGQRPNEGGFPDLAIPTPFEWFPSGAPTAPGGGPATSRQQPPATSGRPTGPQYTGTQTAPVRPPGSAPLPPQAPMSSGGPRSLVGGNTLSLQASITGTGVNAPLPADASPPGSSDQRMSQGGFGAIDEPPSLYSTPSGSVASGSIPSFPSDGFGPGSPLGDLPAFGEVPEFPSMTGAGTGLSTSGAAAAAQFGVPSPIGPEDPSIQTHTQALPGAPPIPPAAPPGGHADLPSVSRPAAGGRPPPLPPRAAAQTPSAPPPLPLAATAMSPGAPTFGQTAAMQQAPPPMQRGPSGPPAAPGFGSAPPPQVPAFPPVGAPVAPSGEGIFRAPQFANPQAPPPYQPQEPGVGYGGANVGMQIEPVALHAVGAPMGAAQPFQPAMQPRPGAPVLVDVTPRALVVETAGGYCDTIIPRNAKIPCERTRKFSTGRDMQTIVHVRVAQGEHPHFMENMYLGEVELSGIRPAPRGEVTVAVTFELDADGTLRVRATDVSTGREATANLQLVGIGDEQSIIDSIHKIGGTQVGPGQPLM